MRKHSSAYFPKINHHLSKLIIHENFLLTNSFELFLHIGKPINILEKQVIILEYSNKISKENINELYLHFV